MEDIQKKLFQYQNFLNKQIIGKKYKIMVAPNSYAVVEDAVVVYLNEEEIFVFLLLFQNHTSPKPMLFIQKWLPVKDVVSNGMYLSMNDNGNVKQFNDYIKYYMHASNYQSKPKMELAPILEGMFKKEFISKAEVENLALKTGSYGDFYSDVDFAYDKINYFMNNFKGKLYRILHIEPHQKLNRKNLGIHFTKDDIRDERFLYDIGILRSDMERDEVQKIYENLFEVIVEVSANDIDILTTTVHLLNYPDEDEVTLKADVKPKIVSVEKYHWDETMLTHPY